MMPSLTHSLQRFSRKDFICPLYYQFAFSDDTEARAKKERNWKP